MARRSITTDGVLVQLQDSAEESLQGDDYGNDINFECGFRSSETVEPSKFTEVTQVK